MRELNALPEDIDGSPSELPVSQHSDALPDESDYRSKFMELSEDLFRERERNSELKVRLNKLESVKHTQAVLDSLIVPMANKIFSFMRTYCSVVDFTVRVSVFGNYETP